MAVFLTTLLILLCIVIVLLILIQRTSGGMGSALGGGAADQVLGAGSAAQLTKLTVWSILGFFVLAVLLYVDYQRNAGEIEVLQRKTDEIKQDAGAVGKPNALPFTPSQMDLQNIPVQPSVEDNKTN